MGHRWKRQKLRLKEKHGWKSRPGHKICVIDRGAIRFDYPESWKLSADSGQINVRDREEPDDNCLLAVSNMRIPMQIADQMPIDELVTATIKDDEREILERKGVVHVPRQDGVELAFMEILHLDSKQHKPVCSRLAIARGSGVYCLITFDAWAHEFSKYEPVWNEALRSLTLGLYIDDPTVGPIAN